MSGKDLSGKIAMITGAGSGIGAGIARVLFERGATLALGDLFGDSAEKTAESLSNDILHDSVDVTKPEHLENFRDKILDKHGTIDILVANAGVIGAKGFSERKNYSKDDWDNTFDVNMAISQKIKHLTLFTFSTENWKRPKKEVNFLIFLLESYIS